jgi:spoIIIJ-associated protein
MSEQSYEAKAATAEEAIAEGLARLRVGRDAVTIEVLDEGSKGFLGLGSREAIVRLTLKSETARPTAVASSARRCKARPLDARRCDARRRNARAYRQRTNHNRPD